MKILELPLVRYIKERIDLFFGRCVLGPRGKKHYKSERAAIKYFKKVKNWWGNDVDYKISKNYDDTYNIDIWVICDDLNV